MLSRIFSKFDHLCEQIGVYKVHTIGGSYVAMSYTGKVLAERRVTPILIDEAFNCLQIAIEMQNILAEENARSPAVGVGQLRMRIGIHTGKIVGGLIGTKVVRYDIIGQDVLFAKKIGSNADAGTISISEETFKLIQGRVTEAGTFMFTQTGTVSVLNRNIKCYQVESVEKDSH